MNRGNQQGQTKEKENYADLLAKRNGKNLNLKSLIHFILYFECERGTEYAFDLAFSTLFPFLYLSCHKNALI